MHRELNAVALLCVLLIAGRAPMLAQEFKLFRHTVQVHGFASQGFIYSGGNNWLSMNSNKGSGAFTDFGLNLSSAISDHLRVGAQVYDRNLGQFGQYRPSLDWAVADYSIRPWLNFRGGKVKTTVGLFNDTQDLEFLHTFALLPQSVYPTDLRDATIAHLGGDVYGVISLRHGLGGLAYTVYAGHRSDSMYSGYPYLLSLSGTRFTRYGGLQYGGDLRWTTPVKGLLIGASRIDEDISAKATIVNPANPKERIPYHESSKADWTNQFYGKYARGKLRIESEYRRYYRDQLLFGGSSENATDVRGKYVAVTFRIARRLEVGGYYSRYTVTSVFGGEVAAFAINQTNTSLPANHIYDKTVTARIDLNRFWVVQVEGHRMNGYGSSTYPDGFYLQVNPQGFKNNTNALVVKTSFHF